MKKIYLFSLSMAISFCAISQSSSERFIHDQAIKSNSVSFLNGAKNTPFWTEDFADGIPGTWTNSIASWVYRGINTIPDNNVGGQGAYSGINNTPQTNDPINSATSDNGFIIFDSDYYDNNGVIGAFGTGMHPTPHNGELMTEMIDMSTYSDVALTFNSYYRTFAGQAFVDFYVGGVLIERVQIHSNITVNNSTSIDEVAFVRVPFAVVGNPDVQISFVFEGTTNIVNTFSGYYFWQIDDIALSETPENLIAIEDVVIGGYWLDYSNYTGTGINGIIGLDYSVTPLSQLSNHPYVIEGVLRNLGYADQNTKLKYDVTGSGIYSGSSPLTSVLAYSPTNTVDSAIVGTTPLSPAIGVYDIAIWGESDSLSTGTSITTDTIKKTIELTDYIYGKDLGSTSPSSIILGGPGDQWHYTTRYEMYANEILYSVRAYITGESVPGAIIRAIIYEVDTTAASDVSIYATSDNYIITPQDTGTWINIPITDITLNPVSLFSGYAYQCGLVGFQSSVDSSFVGTSGTSMYNGEHMRFDEFGLNPNPNGAAGTPTWYYSTRTPMIRMNFDPASASVTPAGLENLKSNISIYPNPSNGIFAIELDITSEYDVTVYNALGQRVHEFSSNSMIMQVDLSSFDKGMYTLEIEAENITYCENIIIE